MENYLRELQQLEGDGPSNHFGLTPLSIWSFVEIVEADAPGQMIPPNEIDEEGLKNDTLDCRSVFESYSVPKGGVDEPLQHTINVFFSFNHRSERDAASMLYLLNESAVSNAHDACRQIALGLQSTFEYTTDCNKVAIFSIHDALELAAKAIEIRDKKNPVQAGTMTSLSMLSDQLSIPISDENMEQDRLYCIEMLRYIGAKLLVYLFD